MQLVRYKSRAFLLPVLVCTSVAALPMLLTVCYKHYTMTTVFAHNCSNYCATIWATIADRGNAHARTRSPCIAATDNMRIYIYIYIFKCIWILHNSTTLYKETVTTAIKTTILTNNFTIATRWSVNSCIVAAALKRQHSLAVSCCKSMAVNSSQPPILILFFFASVQFARP